jgi:hypothetical protein
MPIAILLFCFTIMSPNLMQLFNITSSRASSKAADEKPYMFDTSGFETTAMRMTLPECTEETMAAVKMPAVETVMVTEDCDSDNLTSTLKPTTAYGHQQQEQHTQDVPCYGSSGGNVGGDGEVVGKQQQW